MKDIYSMDYKVIEGELICPKCDEVLTIEQVLENSSVSWPGLDWIYCECPFCKDHMHLEVANGIIRTGHLDGAPGPVFLTCSEVKDIDLIINTSKEYIECIYYDKKYKFIAWQRW